jgi:hypothetical protein
MDISFRNANNETVGGLGLCGETVEEHKLEGVEYIHIHADRLACAHSLEKSSFGGQGRGNMYEWGIVHATCCVIDWRPS